MVEAALTSVLDKSGFVLYEKDNSIKSGIAVDDDNYDTGTFIDRDYDVRRYKGFSISLLNSHGSNGFTYTILECTKDFGDLSELSDSYFVAHADHTDVNVASGARSTAYKLARLTPNVKAVRLRAKRQTTLQDSEVTGYIEGH